MMNPDLIPLTLGPRALPVDANMPRPSYRRLYGMVLDGTLPAEQVNGRWYLRRSELAVIARQLGLVREPVAA